MKKQVIISTIAVFVAWMVMDSVIHGVILGGTYERTASLWRPMAEMKHGQMAIVTLITALMFCLIFVRMFGEKSVERGIEYGLYFGIATGVGMGYGTYSVMPIPYRLALAWFLSTTVEAIVARAIVGYLAQPAKAAVEADA